MRKSVLSGHLPDTDTPTLGPEDAEVASQPAQPQVILWWVQLKVTRARNSRLGWIRQA